MWKHTRSGIEFFEWKGNGCDDTGLADARGQDPRVRFFADALVFANILCCGDGSPSHFGYLRISCISLRTLLSMGLFWGDYEQCRWKRGEIRWEQCCSLSHSGASFLGQSHSQQWFWLEVWATQRKNEQMLADAFRTSTVFGSARVWTVEPLVECRSWCEMRKFAWHALHSCDAGLKQRTSVFPP